MHKTGDDVGEGERRDELPLSHLKRTPATWKQIQNARERNHAEAPTWLALESTVKGWSRTKTSAIPCAPWARTWGDTSKRSGQRVSCNLAVDYSQDARLLSDDLLECPRCVQRWCAVGLADEGPGDCRRQNRQISQRVAEDLGMDLHLAQNSS